MVEIAEIRDIPIEKIRTSKYPLRTIDLAKVDELGESIRIHGPQQPIKVRPVDDEFEVVFGDHRLRAYAKNGFKTVRCYVEELDDAEAFVLRVTENLTRNEFIDSIAEARGFKMLQVEKGFTEADIAKKIGKTQQYVSARMGLLRLEPEIGALITSRLVSAEHGYELSKIEDVRKRTILAELSRKDQQRPLTLMEFRNLSKQSIEEMSKDPRVDMILIRDPMERVKRVEIRLSSLDECARDATREPEVQTLDDWIYEMEEEVENQQGEISLLSANGAWKRDRCASYNGDFCTYWSWRQAVARWSMKQDGDKWRLRVSINSQYCATCPEFSKKL